jgi:hypothetical protein
MNLHKSITVATLLMIAAVAMVLLLSQKTRPMTQASGNQAMSLPLLDYLAELGKADDRFFTIEEAWKGDKPMISLEAQWIQKPFEQKSLQQELERLRGSVPNFSYEVDKTNSRIVHIKDARLAQQKGYGLESVIKRIDFTGKVNELPSAIGKLGIPVSLPVVMDLRQSLDHMTEVQVKGEGLKVRDALSNFIPLEGRGGRLLWVARTKLNQGEVSYVYYP